VRVVHTLCTFGVNSMSNLVQIPARRTSTILVVVHSSHIVLLFQFHNHGCVLITTCHEQFQALLLRCTSKGNNPYNDLVSIGRILSGDRLLSDVMVLSIARHRITLQLISCHHLVCTIDPSWKHSASFRASCRCWGVPHVCTSSRSTYWQEEGNENLLPASSNEKTLLV